MSIVGHNLARRAIGALGLAAGLALFGAAMVPTPSFATATPETNSLNFAAPAVDSGSAAPAAPSVAAPLPASPRPVRAGREVHGNPLWAIPLESLKATRERPILLPSRRPPAPAVVAAPPAPQLVRPAPAEPARPRLALVGAVVGDTEGIAVMVDEMTKAIVRLRTGEDYSGWVLRSVKGREATLQKAQDTMLLALPAPTGAPGQPAGPDIGGTPPPSEAAMPPTMPPSFGPPVSPGTIVTPAVSAPLPAGLVVQPFVPPTAPPSPPPSAPRRAPGHAPPPAVPPV